MIKRKIFVLLMVICMMTTFMPSFAFATDEAADSAAKPQTESVQADEKEEAASEEEKSKEAAPEAEAKTEETKKADEQTADEKQDKAEAEKTEPEAEKAEEPAAPAEEPAPEVAPEEAADFSFTADQADYLSYDPLYIARYASDKYVNIDSIDMSRFVNVVTAARGVATYTIDKDKSLDANTFIAGMNYEMPVYNIDDSSKYYVAIPNVNKFNGKNFPAFGLTVGYNNDEAEVISGWKYEKGILYIPKSAIDNPKNKYEVPEGAIIAVQLNYAIGSDGDFGKMIPVQVLNGKEPKDKKTYAENIFDVDTLNVETGVKHRKASDISVFLNGQMIPIYDDAWEYDSSTGEISIKAMPGVVSSVNVVFKKQTITEKAKTLATSAASIVTDEAYAATLNSMTTLQNSAGEEVKLRFDVSQMFVGWRGSYSTDVIYNPRSAASEWNSVKGYRNSVSYLYGAKTAYSDGEYGDASNAVKNRVLARLWAIQSYAVAADTRLGSEGDQGALTWDEAVTHSYVDSGSGTMTIYQWLNLYRNELEKSREVYGGLDGNSIGGSNNFAAKWPVNQTITGSATPLAYPDGTPKANPSFNFQTSQIGAGTQDIYYAASCSELGKAPESDGRRIYVTCLGLDTASANPYIVLAMVQTNSGQNMTAIYKFGIDIGYVQLTKTPAQTTTSYLTEAPNNYTLAGAQYELYNEDGTRALDVSGNPVTLVTGADGKTQVVGVPTGNYYAVETVASKGFKLDGAIQEQTVTATVANTQSNPAQISSVEMPVYGDFQILLEKQNAEYGYGRLVGTKYRLSYYDVDPNTTDTSGLTPTRTWDFEAKQTSTSGGVDRAAIDFKNDTPAAQTGAQYMENDKSVIPLGLFSIEEIEAPRGLAVDHTKYFGKVEQPTNGGDASSTLNPSGALVVNNDGSATISYNGRFDIVHNESEKTVKLNLKKYDVETDTQEAQGTDRDFVKGSLAGAVYDVYFKDNDLQQNPKVGEIVTDEDGNGSLSIDSRTNRGLLPGTYYVEERIASPGYTLDSFVEEEVRNVYENGQHIIDARADESSETTEYEFDIKSNEKPHHTLISKKDITTGEELPGATLQVLDSEGNIVERWTSTNEPHDIVALHDETQGLKDGKYTLREITAPYGYDVAEDVEFEVKANQIENTVEMLNKPITIKTTATDTETETHQGVFKEEAQIKDVVKITGLYEGRKYKVKGRLMDKATGEPMKDANNEEITAETEEFTATGDTMEVELTFTVDASKFTKDTTTVAFERLERTTKVHDVEADVVPVELQKHEDIDDDDQTIHYGGIIGTTATDKESMSQNILAGKDVTIVDVIEYTNLSTKETYTIDGELYNKTTGQLTGIKVSVPFTPKTPSGTTTVEFKLDASVFAGHDLVAFETLSLKGRVIDEHKDPNDPKQTVHVPKIGTKAGKVKNKKVKDRVSYENLIPGQTYIMKGWLISKKSGKKIKGSEGTVRFTPTTPNGYVEVTLSLKKAKGNAVAFEECYIVTSVDGKPKETKVAEHKDPKDPAQTVKYKPKKSGGRGPKTGDDLPILPFVEFGAALTGLLLMILKRKGILGR